jgi:hypothetical protein
LFYLIYNIYFYLTEIIPELLLLFLLLLLLLLSLFLFKLNFILRLLIYLSCNFPLSHLNFKISKSNLYLNLILNQKNRDYLCHNQKLF